MKLSAGSTLLTRTLLTVCAAQDVSKQWEEMVFSDRDGGVECEPCSAGSTSVIGASSCEACVRGFFSEEAASMCSSCSAGFIGAEVALSA